MGARAVRDAGNADANQNHEPECAMSTLLTLSA
jgi:hypothetical protein